MSQSDMITVSVVTPDGIAYEGTSKSVVCVTTSGSMGILPNRLPLLASLAIDMVKVKGADDEEKKIAVSGGFLEFSDNLLTIISPAAETAENIDINRAISARDRAQRRIDADRATNNTDDLARAEISLRRAINRINVSGH